MTRIAITARVVFTLDVAGFDSTIEEIDIEQATDDVLGRGGAVVDTVTIERWQEATDDD